MQYLSVKNLDKYQHYKDRDPKWIKVYYSILDDEQFIFLSEIDRCRLFTCLILASRTNNKIPNNPIWLKKVMRLDKTPNLQPLVNAGFLVASRDCLEESYQNAQGTNGVLLSSPLLNSLDLGEKRVREKRGKIPIPDDWSPTDSHRKLAEARGLELNIEAVHFKGKAQELGWMTSDWDLKFKNWILQEVKFRQARRAT